MIDIGKTVLVEAFGGAKDLNLQNITLRKENAVLKLVSIILVCGLAAVVIIQARKKSKHEITRS